MCLERLSSPSCKVRRLEPGASSDPHSSHTPRDHRHHSHPGEGGCGFREPPPAPAPVPCCWALARAEGPGAPGGAGGAAGTSHPNLPASPAFQKEDVFREKAAYLSGLALPLGTDSPSPTAQGSSGVLLAHSSPTALTSIPPAPSPCPPHGAAV